MTPTAALTLADKLVGQDRYVIGMALLDLYHKGQMESIQDLDAHKQLQEKKK